MSRHSADEVALTDSCRQNGIPLRGAAIGVLAQGGRLELNPIAERQMEALGNVALLEKPFHPTTFVSVLKTALRGRRRQYEARARLEALRETESHARRAETDLRGLNETLEARVFERTSELEAADSGNLSLRSRSANG
jgi:hypothetical protein